MMRSPTPSRRTVRWMVGAALLGALLTPPGSLATAPAICPFRRITGRPCPTCGMTRSWNAAAHGRLRDSLGFHPLGPASMAAAIWLAVGDRGDERPNPAVPQRVLIALTAAWLAVWLLRLRSAGVR